MASVDEHMTSRITNGSLLLDLPSSPWQATEDAGFYMKPIYKDQATGETTFLMKMDPGAFAPRHFHDQLEEIFVLDGEFYDTEHRYKAGQYCIRAIGAEHETGSETGCTVILIYRN